MSMSATLGGLLKDYRLQKNISQLEISFGVGWKEPSRLSRIEQGRVGRPKRELLNRIMDAMRLNEEERGRLLLAGGYVPTPDEIAKMRKSAGPLINSWQFPAYILDFAGRFLDWNEHTAVVYGFSSKEEQHARAHYPNSLEVVFDPQFILNKDLTDEQEIREWRHILKDELVRFRIRNKYFNNDKWYQETIARLMNNKLFAKLWQESQNQKLEQGISNYEYKELIHPHDSKKRLAFHIFRSGLIQDARFEINYHMPANQETFEFFDRS